MKLVHLIPRTPPPVCGVADYAGCLARTLDQRPGIPSTLVPVNGNPDWQKNLFQEVAASAHVILHYSGYGFSKRGAPLHLVSLWRRLQHEHPKSKLITMFHELYATGPPHSSAFWLSPLQRWVAAKIARLSHAVVTNRTDSAQWLQQHLGAEDKVPVFQVFSNFGEDPTTLAPADRPPRLVMFGGSTSPDEKDLEIIDETMRHLNLQEITIVSHPISVPATMSERYQIQCTGVLEADQMGQALQRCRFGLLDYNPDFLGKSGVLAAYAARGVVPLLMRGRALVSEGLMENIHFLATSDLPPVPLVDQVQAHLRDWYAGHSQAATADAYKGLLRDAP